MADRNGAGPASGAVQVAGAGLARYSAIFRGENSIREWPMPSTQFSRVALASMLAVFLATPALADDADSKNCKIIERPAGSADNSGTLSSSVTAGGGKVTGHSTGGNTVTMNSGNGSVSSSVTTGSGGHGQTVVTNSDGSCTIYRDKEK
jgi:hypothetical protein